MAADERFPYTAGRQQYGLVVSVLISGDRESPVPCHSLLYSHTSDRSLAHPCTPVRSPMPLYTGFIQLGAGLSVGLAGLAAGFAIGIVGDAGVRGTAQQPRLFVGMVRIDVIGRQDVGRS
jgi:F0F1-type ATP synthase membrane subunit c/vacuolar-type H+-ATPase subunit K